MPVSRAIAAILALGLLSCLGTGPASPPAVVPNPNPSILALRDTTVDEGQVLVLNLSATDPQHDSVLFSLLGPPGAALSGRVFTWIPDQSQAGMHIVRFTARAQAQPQRRDTAHVVVTVRDNPRPVLRALRDTSVNEGQSLTFNISATNPSGAVLLYSLTGPAGATLLDTVFTWTPSYSQAGMHRLEFRVQEQGHPQNGDTATLVIFVRDNEDGPVLKPLRDTLIDEGEPLSLMLSATDPAGGGVTYSVLGPEGSVLIATQFAWTPNYSQSGQYVVRFVATDALSRKDTIFVAVRVRDFPISSLPELTPRRDSTVLSGQPLSITLFATDPSSTGITYSMLGPTGASVTGNVFTWTPTNAQAGQHLVRFIATDHRVPPRSDTTYLVLTVAVANLPPVLQSPRDTSIVAKQAFQFVLQASDAESDPLTFSMLGTLPGASVIGNQFSWTPDTTQVGVHVLNFVVTQTGNGNLKDTATVTLTVVAASNGPTGYSADTSLVSYWNFNEGTGSTLIDGRGPRNATVIGTPTWVNGIQGTGMRFIGTSANYAECVTPLPDMQEQTLSVWVYLDEVRYSGFIYDGNGDPAQDNQLGINATGQTYYRTHDLDPKGQILGKTRLQTARWYYLAATGKADSVKIYVNGVLDTAVRAATGTFTFSGHHYRTEIGRVNDGSGHNEAFTKGILDELKVYNKALTPAQIQAEYRRYVPLVLPKKQASGDKMH